MPTANVIKDVRVDWDEDTCMLMLEFEGDGYVNWYTVENPEQLYDRVKAAILPWLIERDEALREYRLLGAAVEADMREAYDATDPKHPDWHDTQAGRWDNRAGK